MINCKRWSDVGRDDCGLCSAGLFGGMPSNGVCLGACRDREPVLPEDNVANAASRPRVQSTKQPVDAIPFELWPAWAKAMASLATQTDRGVGDVAYRLAGSAGAAFTTLMAAIGIPCRCPERRMRWNVSYPLNGSVARGGSTAI